MMKATVLLLVALAVSANGLGFPNFNLGCPLGQASRFSNINGDGITPNTLGVIPYCRVVNGQFVSDLANQVNARTGYAPVYEAAPGWVIITPLTSTQNLNNVNFGNFAFQGNVVSVGRDFRAGQPSETAAAAYAALGREDNNSDIQVGSTIAFTTAGCTSFGSTTGGFTLGLGFTNQVACPVANVLGRFEFANRAGGSQQGVAQGLALPRPYIFYGL